MDQGPVSEFDNYCWISCDEEYEEMRTERAVTRTEEQRMEFCRETTNDSKEEVRNAWNDGRSRRNQNFAPRNKGKTMTRRARGKMQEQERPGLTKCDRMSQISIVKDVSLAHQVYIMTEQPAQSIPSDNYVEKSLILTAY